METAPPATHLQRALLRPIGELGRAEQVEERLIELIAGGHLRPGDRLPPEAELARTFGVSTVTVREALRVLRERELLVTRRGRGGGSFVAHQPDPLAQVRAALAATSTLSLRDLGAHYGAITSAAVRLAVRRATEEEVAHVRYRLRQLEDLDAAGWRRTLDDVQVEMVALSQSARLTREHLRLHVELSHFLRLLDLDASARATQLEHVAAALDAMARGDEAAADRAATDLVQGLIEGIVAMRETSRSSSGTPAETPRR